MQCLPPGYRLYAPVLSRLGADFRPQGGGLTFRCVFPDRHKNGDRNPSAFLKIGDRGELVAHCNACRAGWREFAEYAGLGLDAWFPDQGADRMSDAPAADRPKSVAVAHYEYRDRHGRVYAVKTRWEPGFDGRRPKDFSWKRPLPDESRRRLGVPPGAAAWVKSLDAGWYAGTERAGAWWFGPATTRDGQAVEVPACTPGLYRLPELLAANPQAPVFVVEGEGKADLLAGLGFVAVSGPAGKGKWDWRWSADFAGRRVVAVPDRDAADAAMEYGHRVVASAIYYRAASVRLVELPLAELRPDNRGGDVKDWLAGKFPAGVATRPAEKKAAVVELCKGFEEWRPTTQKAA